MTYNVLSGQSVSDVVMATYGDLSFISQLLLDNPAIASVNATLVSGMVVSWNPALVATGQPLEVTTVPVQQQTILTYLSKDGQNIFDICMQLYGDISMLYKLIQDNNYPSALSYPKSNTLFQFDVTLQADADFFKYLSSTKRQINTGTLAGYIVFSNEPETIIFTSEDGSEEFTPES